MHLLGGQIPGPHPQQAQASTFQQHPSTPTPPASGDPNAGGGWITLGVTADTWKEIYSLEAEGLIGCAILSESLNLSLSFLILQWGGGRFTGLLRVLNEMTQQHEEHRAWPAVSRGSTQQPLLSSERTQNKGASLQRWLGQRGGHILPRSQACRAAHRPQTSWRRCFPLLDTMSSRPGPGW